MSIDDGVKAPHRILWLNGPPGSGKDTAAAAILRHGDVSAREYKMKAPIYRALQGFFDIPDHTFKRLVNEYKEGETPHMLGGIPRKEMISFSEDWVKKRFGEAAFGHLALRTLSKATGVRLTVISDCGFVHEMRPIIEHYGVQNCALVHLHREGCSFVGDSRSYVDPMEFPGIKYVKVINCYEREMFDKQIQRLISKWMWVS
jgi:hypothetical protein